MQAVDGSSINKDSLDNSEIKTQKSVNKKRLALLKTNILYICMPIAWCPYTYACGCLLLGPAHHPKGLQRNFSRIKIPWMTIEPRYILPFSIWFCDYIFFLGFVFNCCYSFHVYMIFLVNENK